MKRSLIISRMTDRGESFPFHSIDILTLLKIVVTRMN